MKISVIQFDPQFGDIADNISKMLKLIDSVKADVFVLPELCSTGYLFGSIEEVESLAENIEDSILIKRLHEVCLDKNCYICGGFAEAAEGFYYNSSFLLGPQGLIGKYRKVHLFLDEKKWFQPGNLGFPVWNIGNVRVGMMICFDWVYPEAARSLALQGADIILHPVNLVLPYCQQAMITRSIENRVFTVTANRIGREERNSNQLVFTGASQVVDPRGNLLFRMGESQTDAQVIEIDQLLAREKNITTANHLFHDRRPDVYNRQ